MLVKPKFPAQKLHNCAEKFIFIKSLSAIRFIHNRGMKKFKMKCIKFETDITIPKSILLSGWWLEDDSFCKETQTDCSS